MIFINTTILNRPVFLLMNRIGQDVRFLTITYFTRYNCQLYNCCHMMTPVAIQSLAFILFGLLSFSQPIMETGGKKMPGEWIDQDTRHKLIRLTNKPGENASFYFHNNPFIGNTMVFYSTDSNGKQLYTLDLQTKAIKQLTHFNRPMSGEIIGDKSRKVFYQIGDSILSTHIDTKATELIFVFPKDFRGNITTINASENLLGGVYSTEAERELFRKNPAKSSYFNVIYEAKLPRTLFTIDIKSKELKKLHTDSAWLNHVQFSSTEPNILMFCHEGPWHKVDRIWTIDVNTRKINGMHKRSMNMEIAGHEFFSRDGKQIWFDLQMPRSVTFFLAASDVKTQKEIKYALTRDEWSIHFNQSPDQKLFAGDGGDSGQVARARDGMWIYLFRPEGDKLVSEKLVNMKHHNYRLEPNVHFSPDGKWVIFRANFEGTQQVYAVQLKKEN
jgi:oligogalacturonide lyase